MTAESASLRDGRSVLVAGDASARVTGFLIDTFIVSIGSLVVLTGLGIVHGPVLEVQKSGGIADRVEVETTRFAIDTAVITLFAGAYFAGSWIRNRSTVGQRAVGLQVLTAADGASDLTASQAVIRFVALGAPLWVIAGLVTGNARLAFWCLGLIWYAVLLVSVVRGSSTTGLHDRIARTLVLRRVTPLVGGAAGSDAGIAE